MPLATIHLQPSMLYSKYAPPHLGPSVLRPCCFRARSGGWLLARLSVRDRPRPRPADERLSSGTGTPAGPPYPGPLNSLPAMRNRFISGLVRTAAGRLATHVTLTGFPLYDERGLAHPPDPVEVSRSGAPPVVFTPGSAMKQGQGFFAAAVDACSKSGRRGMLLTRFPEQVPPPLPDGIRHFKYVPFSQVFPRAAAVVHHGGIGTTAKALAAGAPQLIMHMAHDQPDNAAHVCAGRRQADLAESLP